jgi:hypothetical protein
MVKIFASLLIMSTIYLLCRKIMKPEPTRRSDNPGPNRILLAGIVVALLALLVYMAVCSEPAAPEDAAPVVVSPAAEPEQQVAAVSQQAGDNADFARQMQVDRLYESSGMEAIENQLQKRSVNALKSIPAKGASNVARVLKARNILIADNAFGSCDVHVPIASAPGCLITVFLTRIPPSRQIDLSGVRAAWFKGLDDQHFRPVSGWAKHVTDDDDWLAPGGALDQADTR